jgi:subtilisin family serine protease
LNGTAPLIGASTAWSWGFTGAGWYVAVIDTGIRRTHQFFAGKTIVEACFARGADGATGAGDCPNGTHTQVGPGSATPHPGNYDGYDHGTHVAGIAAGSFGALAGVAKGANIIAIQVFSRMTGTACAPSQACVTSWVSDTLAALDWLYTSRGSYRVASANMSLGGSTIYSSPCDSDSRRAVIDNLRNAGIATIVATGNDASCSGVTSPSCISSSVAVGSSTDSDGASPFNNWHPSLQKLFAPGSAVNSATGSSDTSYGSWSGTSMAAPHVAGAWALMKQVANNGSVTDLLKALRDTGIGVTSTCDSRRTAMPRLRVDRAITTLAAFTLTIQATPYGTTDPVPGAYRYAAGSQVQVAALPETYADFVSWTGGASGSTNPITITLDADKTILANFQFIFPPGATGVQQLNRSFSQGEYINVLRWQPHASNQGLTVTRYRIYRVSGGVRTQVAELAGTEREYQHRHVAHETASYHVVAVTVNDREGLPALVIVPAV